MNDEWLHAICRRSRGAEGPWVGWVASRRAYERRERGAGTIDRMWVAVECRVVWGEGKTMVVV